jgi:hypothetical protein
MIDVKKSFSSSIVHCNVTVDSGGKSRQTLVHDCFTKILPWQLLIEPNDSIKS